MTADVIEIHIAFDRPKSDEHMLPGKQPHRQAGRGEFRKMSGSRTRTSQIRGARTDVRVE